MNTMDCILGIECADFIMLAADQTHIMHNIFIMKNDVDKLFPITEHLIMGVSGESGHILQFTQFIKNSLDLYKTKNGYQLSTEATVHFTQRTLADAVKKSTPYEVNLVIGGWDSEKGGQLYMIEFIGSSVRVPYAFQGLGGLIGISILEHYYQRNMTEAQAYEVMQTCVREVHQRLAANLPNFLVKVISKDGITTLPVISPPLLNH